MVEKVLTYLAMAGILFGLGSLGLFVGLTIWLRRNRAGGTAALPVFARNLRMVSLGFAVSLGSLMLLFVAGEMLLRMTIRYDNPPGFTRKHSTRGYSLNEGYRGFTYDASIEINSRGERGSERAVSLEPGTLRVLVLGDSMTYGIGVPIEETYPARLESALAERLDQPVQVFNLGVPSYNTTDEAIYLEETFDLYRPGLVIMQFMFTNDALFKARPQPQSGFRSSKLWQLAREIPPNSWALTWMARHIKEVGLRLSGDVPTGDPMVDFKAETVANLSHMYAEDAPGWVEARASMRRIQDFLSVRGVPLVFATNVNHSNMTEEYRAVAEPVVELMRAAARDAGIGHFIVIDEAFLEYAGHESDTFVTPHDRHWSSVAHESVANHLMQYLEAHPELIATR